jgi:hypothetical protein
MGTIRTFPLEVLSRDVAAKANTRGATAIPLQPEWFDRELDVDIAEQSRNASQVQYPYVFA